MGNSTGSPVTNLEKAPSTPEEHAQFVSSCWDYVKNARPGLEYRIREAMHFLLGDQWIRYLPYTQQFTQHDLDDWIPTPVTNYLTKHFDRIVDIFTSGNPMPEWLPAGEDQPDIEASYAAQRISHSEWRRLKTDTRLLIPATGWLVLAGNAVIHCNWNGRAGRRMRKPMMQLDERPAVDPIKRCLNCDTSFPLPGPGPQCPRCGGTIADGEVYALDDLGNEQIELQERPVLDENGKQRYRTVKVGEIEERVVNLLNWYPGPARTFDKLRLTVEVDPMDLDEIKHIYGSKAKDVVAESIELDEWQGMYNTHLHGHSGVESDKNRERVLHKWVRHVPNELFPKGLLICEANGQILHTSPLDCDDGTLGYELIKYRDIPGFFWGASVFSDLIPQQKRLNGIDSHLVMNRKKMATAQWLIPDGSGVTEITGQAGLEINYDPHASGGFKPEQVPPIPVPAQVIEERSQTLRDMEDVSGAREVLSGDVPPGPETGAAIEHLIEQAFKRFGPSVKLMRQALSNHEMRKMRLVRKHWRSSRMIRVVGDNAETEVYHYSRADIENAEDMTVRISLGQQFSNTARQQKVLRAAEMGLLGDIRQPEVRGKILEKLDIDGFESEYINDAKKARRVLRAIIRGRDPEKPEPGIDNDAVQLSILRDYMLTAEFSQLPEDRQQLLRERAGMHREMLQQRQQAQMQAAEAAKGAPDQVADQLAQTGALQQQAPQGVA